MHLNEKGFTYPLTLSVLILFLLFVSVRVEQQLTERKMAHETAIIFQEEYYFLSSVKKVEKKLQADGAIPAKGTFTYKNGNVDYQTEKPIGNAQKVNFTIKLSSGETVVGRGFYDIAAKKMIKWVEVN